MVSLGVIIEEVLSLLRPYEELEVLDEDRMRVWAVDALKQFGNLVTVDKSDTIVINNYGGYLPPYFYKFLKAKKCGVEEYHVEGQPPQVLTQTLMRIREEIPIEQRDFVEHLNPNGTYKRIEETLYINTPNKVTAKLIQGGDIELVSGINRDIGCNVPEADKSASFKLTGSRMAIRGHEIDTDFKDGVIYLEYRGYPQDEDGELIIKDGGNGKLKEYIFSHIMRKSFTELWIRYNKDVVTRIQHFTVLEHSSLSPAMSALKAEGIASGQYVKEIKRRNQEKFNRFNRF